MVGKEVVAPQVEVVKVSTSFKYLRSCVSGDGGHQEDVKVLVNEKLEPFGAIRKCAMSGV